MELEAENWVDGGCFAFAPLVGSNGQTNLLRSCLSLSLFSFQLAFFGEISWMRARCFSRNEHSEVDVKSQRGSGSQTEELCALLFPFTSSSHALEDELSCHRLAAGGGFGRPASYFHSLSLQLRHHYVDELSCHRLAAGGGFGRPARYFVHYIYSEDLHQQQT